MITLGQQESSAHSLQAAKAYVLMNASIVRQADNRRLMIPEVNVNATESGAKNVFLYNPAAETVLKHVEFNLGAGN